MHETARQPASGADDGLTVVIALPSADAPSYYQRNTGSLPQIGRRRSSDVHRRAALPSPVNAEPNTVLRKIMGLFGAR